MRLITIIGPTATGKTSVAVRLASLLGRAPILSADSRQVYRGMDLGTGKDLSEYEVGGQKIAHYLIDIAEPGERYNLARYLADARAVLSRLPERPTPILCGGTGLYVEALKKGYTLAAEPEDPALRVRLESLSPEELQKEWYRLKDPAGPDLADPRNPRRLIRAIERRLAAGASPVVYPPHPGPIFCLDMPRDERRRRISERLRTRLDEGMVEEVRRLLARLGDPSPLLAYGLEYRYVTEYLLGRSDYEDMVKKLETAIRQFSKRQMTWIRGMERRGLAVTYVPPADTPLETARRILDLLG